MKIVLLLLMLAVLLDLAVKDIVLAVMRSVAIMRSATRVRRFVSMVVVASVTVVAVYDPRHQRIGDKGWNVIVVVVDNRW